jgi:hypothetical protein
MNQRTKIAIAALVVVLAAASRLTKHPFNFTPIVAMAIFGGYYLKNKWAVILPLAAMVISDYFIGFYDFPVMASVYVSITLAFFIGKYASSKKWFFVPLSSLASSVIFFLVTNFAVWAFFDWYPHTWAGLVTNFTLALPFFRNTLLGDVFYTGVLFGVYELAIYLATKRLEKQASVQI